MNLKKIVIFVLTFSLCMLTACGSNHLFVLEGTPVTTDTENTTLNGKLLPYGSGNKDNQAKSESSEAYSPSIAVVENSSAATSENNPAEISPSSDNNNTINTNIIDSDAVSPSEGAGSPSQSPANEGASSPSQPPANEGASSPSQPPANEGASSPSQPPANEVASNTANSASILYSAHGALSVQNGSLVDASGNPFQVYGMSTHGLAWFPQYVNYEAFQTLRDDWNTNCVRLAMYSAEYNGYCTGGNKDELKNLVKNGVNYATELDMYVIIDWHVLGDQDPNVYKEEAKAFFQEMSSLYADYDNIIYEICNEPNGYATWDSVKSYANEVIPIIRENDSNAVIIVGTPTWSQNIDQAASSPLDYDNLLYALHFYAGTHKDDLRNRLETCAQNGLPVFVSEFGMCDASGNGGNDFDSTSKWMELIEQYNISFCCWNLANKNESSSVFNSSCQATANWTENDLSESGKWIRNYFRSKNQ